MEDKIKGLETQLKSEEQQLKLLAENLSSRIAELQGALNDCNLNRVRVAGALATMGKVNEILAGAKENT